MGTQRNELTIDDVMTDPLIGAVMKADGVAPAVLRALLDGGSDAQKRRDRCLDLPFGWISPRGSRPWTGVKTPPRVRGANCRAPLPW